MRRLFTISALVVGWALSASADPLFETRNIFDLVSKHVHGSSIVECPNGDLLACWFHGSGERSANDVLIQGARLKKGETRWSEVFLMADTPGFPDCNPVLFIDAKDRLWLFWIAVHANRWECSILKYRRAENYQADGAPVWSWQDAIHLNPGSRFHQTIKEKFDELKVDQPMWAEYAKPYHELILEAAQDPAKYQTGWMTRIHPLALPSGRILLPLYSDGFNVSLMAMTDDMGETWRASAPIVGLGPIQPTMARRTSGEIVAYLRDSGDAPPRVMKSLSKDDGETWSAAVDTDIPNPGSSLEVIVLAGGGWLMVFNDSEKGREVLTAAISDDEGATWKWKRQLEPSDAIGKTFGYPSVIQSKDGRVHMTYTYHTESGNSIRHATITPEWVKNNN